LLPPLVLTDEQARVGMDILTEVIADVTQESGATSSAARR
jgi:acetylornithine/succinyldiaminopimelate/putrescine aminotransferase